MDHGGTLIHSPRRGPEPGQLGQPVSSAGQVRKGGGLPQARASCVGGAKDGGEQEVGLTRAVRTATKGRGDGRGESAHRKAAQPILKWRPN